MTGHTRVALSIHRRNFRKFSMSLIHTTAQAERTDFGAALN